MRPSNGLAPYPILAAFRDDYEGSTFSADVECNPGPRSLAVSCNFELYDDALRSLIDHGLASYALHLECGVTSYREVVTSQSPIVQYMVPIEQVSGNIDACTFVVATRPLTGFTSENFHPDYGDSAFDIPQGGILAIGDSYELAIDETDDDGVPPSIIRVSRGDRDEQADIKVNTDGDQYIVIRLNPRTYDLYLRQGEGPLADTVFSLILLPALQDALTRMASGEEDPDKAWYKSIETLLVAQGISIDDLAQGGISTSPMAVAQRIFEDPVARALEAISEQTEVRDED